MKKFSLSAEERETIIRFDDGSKECDIYTCSRPIMTKLDKLCKEKPHNYKLINDDGYSKESITNKGFISFRSGRVNRELTDEQREAASKRMKAMVESKA